MSGLELDPYKNVLDQLGGHGFPFARRAVELSETNPPSIRTFDTGANRNSDDGKLDFEGFLSPPVIEAFGEYMHEHRKLEDNTLRDSDNWQKGIPLPVYAKSLWRHFFDFWALHRGYKRTDKKTGRPITKREACCSLMFNIMGYLHETIKAEQCQKQ